LVLCEAAGGVQVCALQVPETEVRPLQVGAAEVRPLQVGESEVRPLQVGAPENVFDIATARLRA
jgi:hypothetical protein